MKEKGKRYGRAASCSAAPRGRIPDGAGTGRDRDRRTDGGAAGTGSRAGRTAALGVITAAPAMSGKKQVDRAGPPAPERTVENVKADVAEMKGSAHR
ncbi:phage holin family protein [Kitasatospora aureofaciens]|uniref:phage holin family protein n=1 Tax=Kitasatospora aureofaciens TaxID=1894 RepID=UPI003411CC81